MKSSTSTAGWLVKSEPEAYSWADLVRDKKTAWTGVRNYTARIHLNAMKPGDRVFFYESVTTKAIVGVAEVTKAAFPDTTADEPGWVAVELKAVSPVKNPVTLEQMKQVPELKNLGLIRQGRLSVMPVTKDEWDRILKLAKE